MNPFRKPNLTRIGAGIAALVASVTLVACSTTATTASSSTDSTAASSSSALASSASAALADNVASHAEAGDTDYEAASATPITLADGASTTSSTDGVTIKDDAVTVTAPGTYLLTGALSNGQVVVNSDAEGKVRIVLDNASITNSAGSALMVTGGAPCCSPFATRLRTITCRRAGSVDTSSGKHPISRTSSGAPEASITSLTRSIRSIRLA